MSRGRSEVAKIGAFIRRDILHATSYKLAFGAQLATLGSSILTVYFLSRMIGHGRLPMLAPYGGDYFAFALVGTALADYLAVSISGFSRGIRLAQTLGTLEAMLATPTRPATIVIGSAAYQLLWSGARVAAYLGAGVLLGARFPLVDPLALVLATVLSVLAFAAVGVLGASLVLVLKAWEPVTALFAGASMLLGGVLYPVSSLPEVARVLAAALPITHALEAVRGALLMGRSVSELGLPLGVLLGFVLVTGPLAAWSFRRAVRHLRREGSVSHY